MIFPEGTRFHPNKPEAIEKSCAYARERGYAPLVNLLTPRVRGMFLALTHLREKLDAVYDVTVAYSQSRDARTGVRREAPNMFGTERMKAEDPRLLWRY